MQNVVDRFKEYKGLKTRKGAMSRLEKAMAPLAACSDKSVRDAAAALTYVIAEKEDGTFMPIVFLTNATSFLAGDLVHKNVAVTTSARKRTFEMTDYVEVVMTVCELPTQYSADLMWVLSNNAFNSNVPVKFNFIGGRKISHEWGLTNNIQVTFKMPKDYRDNYDLRKHLQGIVDNYNEKIQSNYRAKSEYGKVFLRV